MTSKTRNRYELLIEALVPEKWFPTHWTVTEIGRGITIKTPELSMPNGRITLEATEIILKGWDPKRTYVPTTHVYDLQGDHTLELPEDIFYRGLQKALQMNIGNMISASNNTVVGVFYRIGQQAQRTVSREVREKGLLRSRGTLIPKENIVRVDSQWLPNVPSVHPAWAQHLAHLEVIDGITKRYREEGKGTILNVSSAKGTALFQVTKNQEQVPLAVRQTIGHRNINPDRLNVLYGLNCATNIHPANLPIVEEVGIGVWENLVVCHEDGSIPVTLYTNSSIYGEDMVLVRKSSGLKINIEKRVTIINCRKDLLAVEEGDIVDPGKEIVFWDQETSSDETDFNPELTEALGLEGLHRASSEDLSELEFRQRLLELATTYSPGVWQDDPEPPVEDVKAHKKWAHRQARKAKEQEEILPKTVAIKGSLLGIDGLGKEHHARIPYPAIVTAVVQGETVLHGDRVPTCSITLDIQIPLTTGQKVVTRGTAKGTIYILSDEEMDSTFGPEVEVVWQGEKANRHSHIIADMIATELAHRGINGWSSTDTRKDVEAKASSQGIEVKRSDGCYIGRLPFVASQDHNPWAVTGVGNRFPTRQLTRGHLPPQLREKLLFGSGHSMNLLKDMLRIAL